MAVVQLGSRGPDVDTLEGSLPRNGFSKQAITEEADNEEEFDSGSDDLTTCGIGPFKPKWIQRLANKKVYLASYCGLNLCQGMFYSYIISVLTTIEKRFGVSSKTSGFMMTGNEFSQILFAVLVAYYGSRGHRPRWIAVGMFVSALSCFIISLPEFIFPANKVLQLSFTNASVQDVCHDEARGSQDHCGDGNADINSLAAMAILFLGLFVSGIGSLALYSLGLPYMDDNVGKKKAPAYLGISVGLRVLGPASGYMIGGATLRIYHDPTKEPDFGVRDPRWIGAWWMGFMIIGIAIAFFACFMLLFPKELPRRKGKKLERGPKTAAFPPSKDLPLAIKRVVTNPLLIFNGFDLGFWLLATIGFNTFAPKYYEAKFGKSASGASFITGLSSVFVMMFGFILSGFIIQRFKPRARFLVGYSFCVGLVNILGLLVIMTLSCEERINVHGTVVGNSLEITETCNSDCHCTKEKYTPVCDVQNSVTYFTGCHLGCTEYNTTSKEYSNCSCASETADVFRGGKCPNACSAFYIYIFVTVIIRFLNSTDRIGGTLIFFRSMEPRDKSLAAGMLNGLLCIMAFLPASVVYGAAVDTTCLVWEESCGRQGNCWLYDTDRLGYWLHGLTAGLLCMSNICEIFLCYFCKKLNLYEDISESAVATTEDDDCGKKLPSEIILQEKMVDSGVTNVAYEDTNLERT